MAASEMAAVAEANRAKTDSLAKEAEKRRRRAEFLESPELDLSHKVLDGLIEATSDRCVVKSNRKVSGECAPPSTFVRARQRRQITEVDVVDEEAVNQIPATAYPTALEALELTKKCEWQAALPLWSQLIDLSAAPHMSHHLDTTDALFNCRALCHFKLGNTRCALKDSQRCVEMNPNCVAAHRRIVRCHLLLLDSDSARSAFDTTRRLSSAESSSLSFEDDCIRTLSELMAARERRQPAIALRYATRLCELLHEAPFEEIRVELLVQLSPRDALDDAERLAEEFSMSSALWYWRGHLQFQLAASSDDLESAQTSLLRAVSLSGIQGHAKAKHELQRLRSFDSRCTIAQGFIKTKRWRQALPEIESALTLPSIGTSLRAFLLSLRAQCNFSLQRYGECIVDCGVVIAHLPRAEAEFRLLRAESYVVLQQLDLALRDVLAARHLAPQLARAEVLEERIKELIQRGGGASPPDDDDSDASNTCRSRSAREGSTFPQPSPRLPRCPTAPFYDTLGVRCDVSPSCISKAYRSLALRWHPDKWAGADPSEIRFAEERFKRINEAYAVLSDAALRQQYNKQHGL
jgi:tetratricopeptide (TPR) repeat protein